MVMTGRRGLLRIVESSIAVLLIIVVMLLIMNNRSLPSSEDLSDVLQPLLEEIAKNNTLRGLILTDQSAGEENIVSFMATKIKNPALSFDVKVCSPGVICALDQYPQGVREIFADERIISSTLDTYEPKKVKIFLWIKPNN